MSRTFVIEGTRVHDIASFYDELNRVFMPNEAWTLGASLDALDDLLYGGFGELLGVERPVIVLRDHAHARDALGIAATGAYYREKIAHPEMFHVERFEHALAELDAGRGETYFDLVLGVFAGHDDVRLVLD
ncbi:MAG: ribonuclease inhibitor [Microbacterium sp. SCN 70-27]|uniref:barstar family protein n=1 Tax=unclassified Microbacterium TaxID=2609290 RepID=UPI000869225F|nr:MULTISPECIES: barstar family protein [unclassified Microbacterium]MBN9225596.1 barstar family protein [Microbacterium sp.]ODT28075.1 MAG: ribonuclease inhibitor [Microbacterium sp. SCN 70-27]